MERDLLVRPVRAEEAWLRRLAYQDPQTFPVLLDSATRGPLAHYTILGAYPQGSLCLRAGGELHATGAAGFLREARPGGFLAALQAAWLRERRTAPGPIGATGAAAPPAAEAGPFRGGWMVFLSYELAAEVEPQLSLPRSSASDEPVALALRIPAAVVLEHQSGRAWVVAEPAQARLLKQLEKRLAQAREGVGVLEAGHQAPLCWELDEEPAERYLWRVRRALEYIAAGDIYQANLSRLWQARLTGETPSTSGLTGALYERLRQANPAPFAALCQHGGWQLLCSSPERLVRVRAGQVETRPIAGTRARSGQRSEEAAEIAALISHPKERAEHVMLVDLERNDLGRLCEAGSVRADPMLFVESYAHVHHIVSSVSGRLRPELTPVDVMRAVFPGGTITGCPKYRCMQIIAELEGEARGAYTGALGYINHDGSMDLNILIRTLTLQQGRLQLRAGAGIVADSDPQRELDETRAKARGLLRALQSGAWA
jgi:anthranilate synthase component 1